IREALSEPVGTIVNAVKECLEKTPPELSADVMDRGIILAGGGSLLQGLDKLLSRETGISVFVCEDPLTAVARGTGIVLDHLEYLKGLSASSRRYQQG
ncbi:MAG TPA: rod shape-determining protein, partial [Bacillota bacterium]|nr:rod shape-determining protein [Bacillota bacterium]